MKTLILYHSRFGAVELCARRLADYIGSEASIQRLSEANQVSIDSAEALILGASVDKGHLIRPMAEFLAKNPDLGVNRPLGLFLCHGEPDGLSLLKRCYPPAILARARAAEAVGGYLDLSKVPRMLRFLLAIFGVKKSYDRLDNVALKRLAEAFK